MGKRSHRGVFSARHSNRIRVIEVYLLESEGGLAVVSKWHEHLEESMNAVERVALTSALGSVAKVLGEFTERDFNELGVSPNMQA